MNRSNSGHTMAHSRKINMLTYPDEIVTMPMFHPEVTTREMAERYVLQNSQGRGSFIVRPNTDNDPSYVSITISIPGESVSNVRVFIDRNHGVYKYYILEKHKFSSFNELLTHYHEHRIHCLQGIANLRLLIPLEKERKHVHKWGSFHSVGKASTTSTGSSSSDDAQQGHGNRRVAAAKNEARSNSEPHAVFHHTPFNGANKHKVSSRDHCLTHSESLHQSSKQAPYSQSVPNSHFLNNMSKNFNNNLFSSYVNSSSIKRDRKMLMMARLPLPTPEASCSDGIPTYSSTSSNKNFLKETYEFLKTNDYCDCGLQFECSELPLGWTIHLSQDPASLGHVFFQHGDVATWEMPAELVDNLTPKQIKFIVSLHQESKQPFPASLRKQLDRMTVPKKGDNQGSVWRETLAPSPPTIDDLCYTNTSTNQINISASSSTTSASHKLILQNRSPNDSLSRDFQDDGVYETPESLLVSQMAKLDLSAQLPSRKSNTILDSTNVISDSPADAFRPMTFDSIPTLTIQAKIGSPSKLIAGSFPPIRSNMPEHFGVGFEDGFHDTDKSGENLQ